MPLTSGITLSPYQILSPLGAGGMGEVYKARDTRLDRTVAIKVLPEHVASDPDLRQRFEREAKTISSLNHPHICTLFDVGEHEGTNFLVMEYLEGDTLAQRLKKGAVPLEQVLEIAVEIADALDKAHRQGITHRDLKPGNIMLTKSGAKLLDFGLAKLRPSGTVGADGFSAAATQSEPLTGRGTILGTLQYMAPEQVEGKEADHRTDIFAFGALVYEMATGQRAFSGESQASLIAAILEHEPVPMSTLQPVTPAALDYVVKNCLAKDPDDRWRSAGDVGRHLRWISGGGSQPDVSALAPDAPQRSRWRQAVPWVVAAAAIAGVVMVSVSPLDSGSTTTAARFLATTSDSLPIVGSGEVDLAISPDGTTLVYSGGGPYGVNDVQLVRRSVDDLHAMPIEGGGEGWQPFFSPDGQWVGYATYPELALMRLPIEGGAPVTIMPPEIFVVGATWAEDDTIIFTLTGSGLYQIPVSGGEAKSLTAFDETVSVGHRTPRALPGGRGVLFFVQGRQRSDDQVAVLDLDTGDWRTLMPGSGPRYAETGHLVYALAGDLYAAPFDLATLTVTGAARVVVSGIMVKEGNGNANFALSRNGTLVYAVGGTRSEARSCG